MAVVNEGSTLKRQFLNKSMVKNITLYYKYYLLLCYQLGLHFV